MIYEKKCQRYFQYDILVFLLMLKVELGWFQFFNLPFNTVEQNEAVIKFNIESGGRKPYPKQTLELKDM